MDTDGLSFVLQLCALVIVFGYMAALEHAIRRSYHVPRKLFSLLAIKYAITFLKVSALLTIVALYATTFTPKVGLTLLSAILTSGVITTIFLVGQYGLRKFVSSSPSTQKLLIYPFYQLANDSTQDTHPSTTDNAEETWDFPIFPADNNLESESLGTVLIEEGQTQVDPRERLMIKSILKLDESMAREIMIPRIDMVTVGYETSIPDVVQQMISSGHSRLPVHKDTIDNIIGIVHSRDLLQHLTKSKKHPSLTSIIREALFTPESKRLDDLLKEMQEKRIHMALVVDEYGGVEGLITLEDLLEEIVGEIEDEFSNEYEQSIVRSEDGTYMVDPAVTLEHLSQEFGIEFAEDDMDTVGGLIYSTLGRIPQAGDTYVTNSFRLDVLSVLGRRLRTLKLTILDQ